MSETPPEPPKKSIARKPRPAEAVLTDAQVAEELFSAADNQLLWEEAKATSLAGYVIIAGIVGLIVLVVATPLGQWIMGGTGAMVDELFTLGQAEVVRVEGARSGTLRPGQRLTLEVVFPRAMTVTGRPTLPFDVGGERREMIYDGQLSPGRLRFVWRAGDADVDLNGITWPDQLDLSEGRIVDEDGRKALPRLPADYHGSARLTLGQPGMLTVHEQGGFGHLMRGDTSVRFHRARLPEVSVTAAHLVAAGSSTGSGASKPPELWLALGDGRVMHSTDLSSFSYEARSDGPLTSIVSAGEGGAVVAGGMGRVLVFQPSQPDAEVVTLQLAQKTALLRGLARDPEGTLVAVSEQGQWFRARPGAELTVIGDIGRPGFYDVIWHGGQYLAIAGRTLRASTDGLNWSVVPTDPDLRGQLRHITAAEPVLGPDGAPTVRGFVAVGSSAGEILVRPAGASNWAFLPDLPDNAELTALAALPGRVLAATRKPTALLEFSSTRHEEGWRPLNLPNGTAPITHLIPVR